MTAPPLTLTDFLLARIAEDEKAARIGLSIDDPLPNTYGVWEHERVLAECEAKRRIVTDRSFLDIHGDLSIFGERILGTLTLPYADHPDYCDEWKP